MPFKGENSSFTKDFSKLFVLGKIIFKLLQNNSMYFCVIWTTLYEKATLYHNR